MVPWFVSHLSLLVPDSRTDCNMNDDHSVASLTVASGRYALTVATVSFAGFPSIFSAKLRTISGGAKLQF